jgi:hypothetical protein
MISMPGMPSVKHTAELYFDQEKCEARRIVIENGIVDMALEQGINPIYTQTWCLESSMFVINNS